MIYTNIVPNIYCKLCCQNKCEDDFYKLEIKRKSPRCKFCISKINKKYRLNNKDKKSQAAKKYRIDNKEKIKQKKKEDYQNNKEKYKQKNKQYYINNKEKVKQVVKKYRSQNKDKRNISQKNKRKNDIVFKLRDHVSKLIHKFLKNSGYSKNNKSILNYLPYTIEQLKQHLESLFEPWMNWNNHGCYKPNVWNDNDSSTWVWNLDHIIPQSDLPYGSMEHPNFLKCWALNNVRPYPAKQNILDGAQRIRHKKAA